ncbi:MAG: type I-U CRISPR-associated protein Csx17 [Armatimonadota bacterium]|nr:type I-U CRISPR-associated protein Csx17 [Armatimonadota bacterium]
MLRLLARTWPSVRIAWPGRILHVVGAATLDEILNALVDIASGARWTPYRRDWLDAQKKSKQTGTGHALALWQADASEDTIELFGAHAVAHGRVAFNPLLGTGGNAGQREFAKGWRVAVDALKSPRRVDARDECRRWLVGEPVSWMLSGIAAASWFSAANKLYNSGQSAFREEPLSPWAMALACEGLPFFAGGPSRRLGARARAQGAFPFICQAGAPGLPGEAGRDRGEVWVPIWERPMTLPEVRALFQRGRAEVRGRGARTPAAFAAAIVHRGVDAGVSCFVRFALGATTSTNTFEPRCQGTIEVRRDDAPARASARSAMVERVLALIERLPADWKKGRRWRFVGLRGSIEAALVRFAEAPEEPGAARGLLDAAVSALDKVDRNVLYRKAQVAWQPFPIEEMFVLFQHEAPGLEARLALALVSGFPADRPFTLYRFGVEWRDRRFLHPEKPPGRWVYRPGLLPRILVSVLLRYVVDWEQESGSGKRPGAGREPIPVSAADVQRWLNGCVDEVLLARWLGRFSLFDWRNLPSTMVARLPLPRPSCTADGSLLLTGLMQPLFDARPLRVRTVSGRDALSSDTGARTPAAARAIATLVRTGQVDAAVRLTAGRYAMARLPLIRSDATWKVAEPERLLAALLFPITHAERSLLVERWLRPARAKGEHCHV